MRAIHFKRFDGTIGGAQFIRNMPGKRTAIKIVMHMQIDNDRITKRLIDGCYRCYGFKKVLAPNGEASTYPNTKAEYECPACSWRK